jgi:hypothetical protein
VEALARYLKAYFTVADAKPGAVVFISHWQVAAADSGAKIVPLVDAV